MFTFYLNHKKYNLGHIHQAYFKHKKANAWSKEEKITLKFLKQWFSPQKKFLVYTSGSTGRAKKIFITRQQMIYSACKTVNYLSLQHCKNVLIPINTQYIGGIMMLVRALVFGWTIHCIDPCKNPLLLFTQKHIKFDFAAFVPLQLSTILKENPQNIGLLDGMKAIIVGGAPINDDLYTALQSIQSPVYHTYGMTETLSHIALKRMNGAKKKYYQVFNRVQIDIDNKDCLVIYDDVITNGKKIYTNDIVKIHSTHTFEWYGRYDYVINSGGYKIIVEKIERSIAKIFQQLHIQCPFFMTSIPDKMLGSKLVLVLEKEYLCRSIRQQFYKKCLLVMPKYSVPKKIYYAPILAKINEKIDRKIDINHFFAENII